MLPVKRINFFADRASFETLVLASLGFSNRLIRKVTGLSNAQINYRLWKRGISRTAYRDGISETANHVIRSSRKYVESEIDRQLKKMLKA